MFVTHIMNRLDISETGASAYNLTFSNTARKNYFLFPVGLGRGGTEKYLNTHLEVSHCTPLPVGQVFGVRAWEVSLNSHSTGLFSPPAQRLLSEANST